MNSQVASYYRAIIFNDGQDPRQLPKSLVKMDSWASARHQALGLGSTITKASALAVALAWLSGTEEGRKFSQDVHGLNGMFAQPAESQAEVDTPPEPKDDSKSQPNETTVNWKQVKTGTPVVITEGDKQINGTFVGQRGSWIDVIVNSEEKHFQTRSVKLGA